MTYLEFVLLLIVPPVAALACAHAVAPRGPRRAGPVARREGLTALAVYTAIALVWTVPWDRWVIARGLWSYPPGRVRAWWWGMPAEEYAFVVLQACGVGLWACLVMARRARRAPEAAASAAPRARAAAGWLAVGAAAVAALAAGPERLFYLGALFAWCALPLAVQRLAGADVLRAERRTRALAVVPPVVFLCAVDRWALAEGIWVISPDLTVGLRPLGVPVEEVVFFLVTSGLLVDGLLLSIHPAVRARVAGSARTRGGGSAPAGRVPGGRA